ncbi:MAG: AraC family transcriptional regulator [Bradyrhizobiaceae bacterium]|nr:AraC family transcriptional regulator [Bradyrhizobiaceae bacterium]
MLLERFGDDSRWSSHGLPPREALRDWQDWTSKTLTPLYIESPDEDRFAAGWTSFAMGPVNLVSFESTPQRAVHPRTACGQDSSFQLAYCTQTPMHTRIGSRQFRVEEGEFVLLDNTQPYEVRLDAPHKMIDLIMPISWLERWLPDPTQFVERSFSATSKWGLPLGTYLSTMVRELHQAALPRGVLADQVGALLALAVGHQPSFKTRHKAKLVQRLLRLIEDRYSEPELAPDDAAKSLGISKRYLHTLLADAGMTFMGALNRVRMERACEFLADRRFDQLQIAEISWRCGYLDPSYFARVFRAGFGVGPREWRNTRQPCAPNAPAPAGATLDHDHECDYGADSGSALRIRAHKKQDAKAICLFDGKCDYKC